MCEAIEFAAGRRRQIIQFDAPQPMLPLINRYGQISWLPWGVARDVPTLSFPHGGTIRRSYLLNGRIKAWHPKAARVPAARFQVVDAAHAPVWVELDAGLALAAVILERDRELHAYLITEAPPPEYAHIPAHWPRILPLPPAHRPA